MNERWVCKRCFADNEETDSACVRCGLTRGAEATEVDAASRASDAGMPAGDRQRGWKRWIRYWWVPALGIALLVGYLASARRDDAGQITGGGSLSVEDLRVGDCFDTEVEDEISSVDAHPCDEPHGYEMFEVATWTGSDEYPTEDAMTEFVISECIPAFGEYVGRSYETSALDFVHFVPGEEGWEDGDRVFQCALFDPDRPELSVSQRDADR